MRVSKESDCGAIAGALAGVLRAQDKASLDCMGPAACYQAVRALCLVWFFSKDEDWEPVVRIHSIRRTQGEKFQLIIRFDVEREKRRDDRTGHKHKV